MRPVIGIFAHPDDEAFGPSGTLAILSKTRDVYLICVTNGDEGKNSSNKTEDIASIRRDELLASANMLGIKKVFFLGFKDGSLSNNLYHTVAEKIQTILAKIDPELLITQELHGVSGHIDHIAVSFITTFVFQKHKNIQELWYYCISKEQRNNIKDYFVYFPPGYTESEITKSEDVSSVWAQKMQAIQKHESQIHDAKRLIEIFEKVPKVENFIVVTHNDI